MGSIKFEIPEDLEERAFFHAYRAELAATAANTAADALCVAANYDAPNVDRATVAALKKTSSLLFRKANAVRITAAQQLRGDVVDRILAEARGADAVEVSAGGYVSSPPGPNAEDADLDMWVPKDGGMSLQEAAAACGIRFRMSLDGAGGLLMTNCEVIDVVPQEDGTFIVRPGGRFPVPSAGDYVPADDGQACEWLREWQNRSTNFRSKLLDLIAKADPENTARLRTAYPGMVLLYERFVDGLLSTYEKPNEGEAG